MKRINKDVRSIGNGIVLVLCFCLLVTTAIAQQNRSTIGGMVFDAQRNPVTQAPVELLNDFNSVIQRTKTDGSGRFIFRAISFGRFTVKVLPLGTNLEEQSQEVEIGGVGADGRPIADSIQMEFYLRVRRNLSDIIEVKGVLFAQEIPPTARKSYEAAISDLNANKVDAGIIALQTAIKEFPNYYLALARLGLLYLSQNKFDNAIDVLTKAVSVNDRSYTAWYGLCYAAFSINKPEASIIAAERALEIDKNAVSAFFLLGMSQRRLKQYDAAEKSLLQAKKLDKGSTPDINWNLALLYAHNLKRYNDAANELEAYLKFNPNAPNREAVKKLIKQFRETPNASDRTQKFS